MSNSGAGGVVVGVLGMGAMYLLSLAFVQMLLFAALGMVVAVAFGIGMLIQALRAWSRSLRTAKKSGNDRWMVDLFFAPFVALCAARVFSPMLADFLVEAGEVSITGGSDGAAINIFAGVLGISAFILWVWLFFSLPRTLAIADNATRAWAYPAYIFWAVLYGGYITAWVQMA